MEVKNVFVLTKPDLDEERSDLASKIVGVSLSGKVNDYFLCNSTDDLEGIEGKADMMLVLGGDGTTLGAARFCTPRGIPMLVLHFGTRGFLSAVRDPEFFSSALEKVLSSSFDKTERMLLECKVMRNGRKVGELIALNEMNIKDIRGDVKSSKLVTLDFNFTGEFQRPFTGDGLMVSTPTGSTGFVGQTGPIIHPRVKCILVRGINEFGLPSIVPFVVPDDELININILESTSTNLRIIADGQESLKIKVGDKIRIQKYPKSAIFLSPHNLECGKNTFWKAMEGLK